MIDNISLSTKQHIQFLGQNLKVSKTGNNGRRYTYGYTARDWGVKPVNVSIATPF